MKEGRAGKASASEREPSMSRRQGRRAGDEENGGWWFIERTAASAASSQQRERARARNVSERASERERALSAARSRHWRCADLAQERPVADVHPFRPDCGGEGGADGRDGSEGRGLRRGGGCGKQLGRLRASTLRGVGRVILLLSLGNGLPTHHQGERDDSALPSGHRGRKHRRPGWLQEMRL